MKKKILLSILALVCLVSSFGLGAYAAVKYTMSINGKAVPADIKVISGTPYIPLSSLNGLKGITIKHDAKKGTISIDDVKPAANNSANQPSAVGLSRNNPAPIGTTVTFNKRDILEDYQATFKVEQIIRGDEAWKMIKDANMFNSEPSDGYEYMLAKISVGITKNAKKDAQVSIRGVSFKLVSSGGKDYAPVIVVVPDPELNSDMYVGASNAGWAAFIVKTDDSNPLLTFGRNYDGTGGVWLKTK